MRDLNAILLWLENFKTWIAAAPEGCDKIQPCNIYWGLGNCSLSALQALQTKWGGHLDSTAGGTQWLLDVHIEGESFRFSTSW